MSALEDDIKQLQQQLNPFGGWKDEVQALSTEASNPGVAHYTDASSLIFSADRDFLPQLRKMKCWSDSTAVIGYELEYADDTIYRRVGTAPLPTDA